MSAAPQHQPHADQTPAQTPSAAAAEALLCQLQQEPCWLCPSTLPSPELGCALVVGVLPLQQEQQCQQQRQQQQQHQQQRQHSLLLLLLEHVPCCRHQQQQVCQQLLQGVQTGWSCGA